MIKDNQKNFSRLHVVIDACVITLSYMFAWALRFIGPFAANAVRARSFQQYMSALVFILPAYILLYHAFSLYEPMRMQGRRLVLSNIVKANSLGILITTFILYTIEEGDISRSVLYMFYGICIVASWGARMFIFYSLRKMRKKGLNQKQVVLVGYSRAAEEYIDRIQQNPQWGYVVRGILDDNITAGTMYKGVKVIGRIANLNVILPENRLDEIAITLGLSEYYRLEEIVALCEKSGVHTKFIPDYNKIIPTKPYTEDILGLPVINIRHVPLTNTFNSMVKRSIDIFGALVAIILFSPIMLISAILVKTTSKGPLIFRQERVGLHNKPFYMYKFRSMYIDAEERKKELMAQNEVKGLMFKMDNDPRITKVGRFIRKTSIDELPQFFNVLKGDMSLVGTRPPTVDEFEQYNIYYRRRLSITPGLTGMWQVSGRSDIKDFDDVVKLDLKYIDEWSLRQDVKILIQTVGVVLFGKGSK